MSKLSDQKALELTRKYEAAVAIEDPDDIEERNAIAGRHTA